MFPLTAAGEHVARPTNENSSSGSTADTATGSTESREDKRRSVPDQDNEFVKVARPRLEEQVADPGPSSAKSSAIRGRKLPVSKQRR